MTRRTPQRGAALLMAMIIVTLVATLAVSMVWQQWRAVQVETAERARTQSAWILTGALDWAALILKEDAKSDLRSGGADHLGEPWAVPLAEARLSTFLAVDKDNTDDAPDTFLSGSITDAQARFNLNNLVDASGQVLAPQLATLRRLCANVDVALAVADQLADGLRNASVAPGASGASANPPLKPKRVDQLSWLGVDPEALRRLAPHITLLPASDLKVNINTASREVIAAAIPGLNVGDAERLVQYRRRTPFRKEADIVAQLPNLQPGALDGVGVVSNYFEVRGRLRLADHVLEQRSLLLRSTRTVNVLSREWVSSHDAGN